MFSMSLAFALVVMHAGLAVAAPAAPVAPVKEKTATIKESLGEPFDAPRTAEEDYDDKIRELEGMVGELRDQIFRSKAKLSLLTQQVSGEAAQLAPVNVTHKNQLSDTFVVANVSYVLDGQPIWQQAEDGAGNLNGKKKHAVYVGNLVEGSHSLMVTVTLRGNGNGVFSYLADYKMKLPSTATFNAVSGKALAIEAVLFEKGDLTTPFTARPKLRLDLKVVPASRNASLVTPAEAK